MRNLESRSCLAKIHIVGKPQPAPADAIIHDGTWASLWLGPYLGPVESIVAVQVAAQSRVASPTCRVFVVSVWI
jgi:hypothetical protein